MSSVCTAARRATALLMLGSVLLFNIATQPHDTHLDRQNVGRQLRHNRQQQVPQQQEQAVAVEPLLKVVTKAAGPAAWNFAEPVGPTPATGDCSWTAFIPPGSRTNGTICLRAGADLLGDTIRQKKYWPECADLPALMAAAAPSTTSGNAPVFLDIGANVGACSLHMLLSTEATVLSFEPGPDNAFYASQSLLRLMHGSDGVQDRPAVSNIAGRALLVRTALGSQPSAEMLLHQAVGNAGHAVIGFKPTQYAPLGHVAAQKIIVRRLDDMLWPPSARAMGAAPPSIALLKMDVEG